MRLGEAVIWMLWVSPAAAGGGDGGYISPWRTPWTYQGERGSEHWSDLDPLYAACKGSEQSPIDIRHAVKANLPKLGIEYHRAPIDYVVNNGHTIRVNYGAPGSGDYLIVGEKRYELTQFHFHRPSEERIGGKAYDMVVHLMHQSSDGEVAGVAVLVKAGRPNATVQAIWDHMPDTEGQRRAEGLAVDPADFLPGRRDYYSYTGSQTAPPCTEGVKWIVLKQPIELSAGEIEAFAKLYPDDVRPVQPLNGRLVSESR
jgi:carbonic anhydrase